MAYSRWSNSVWYTYHCATSGDTRDDQSLWIGHRNTSGSCRVDYEDLRDVYLPSNDDDIPNPMRKFFPEATTEELDELENYIFWFMDDVEEDYPDETNADENR